MASDTLLLWFCVIGFVLNTLPRNGSRVWGAGVGWSAVVFRSDDERGPASDSRLSITSGRRVAAWVEKLHVLDVGVGIGSRFGV